MKADENPGKNSVTPRAGASNKHRGSRSTNKMLEDQQSAKHRRADVRLQCEGSNLDNIHLNARLPSFAVQRDESVAPLAAPDTAIPHSRAEWFAVVHFK